MTDTAPSAIPAPRQNPDLVGHERAEAVLLEAWRSERLPHAWLICGPRGIGKATLAFRFARFVLAQGAADGGGLFGGGEAAGPESLYVDPVLPVFRRVAAGGHADMVTLERGYEREGGRLRNSVVIDDVRKAGRFMALTAGEGGWRVVVVDAADDLNVNAANALLKLLEEPPARALVLLVSHAPGRLAATIRSRCCRLALRPLAEDTVAALLARHAPTLGAADAAALARLAEGSIGRALGLAEADGLALYRELIALVAPLPGVDIPALHKLADRLARPDAEAAYRTTIDLLTWWLARMVRAGVPGPAHAADAVEAAPGESEIARRLRGLAGLDRWAEVWEKIGRMAAQADGLNLDRKQVVLNAFHALETVSRG